MVKTAILAKICWIERSKWSSTKNHPDNKYIPPSKSCRRDRHSTVVIYRGYRVIEINTFINFKIIILKWISIQMNTYAYMLTLFRVGFWVMNKYASANRAATSLRQYQNKNWDFCWTFLVDISGGHFWWTFLVDKNVTHTNTDIQTHRHTDRLKREKTWCTN